jgi:hypothetical protein
MMMQEQHCQAGEPLSDELLSGNKPMILRGLIKHWPLVKEGQCSVVAGLNYLRQFYNHKPVFAMVAPPTVAGRFFYNAALDGFNFSHQQFDLSQMLDTLLTQCGQTDVPAYYLGSTSVKQILPGFREHNDIPQLADKPLVSIWIGNQSRVAAHYDVTDNVACVAMGKRRFTLFPPDQLDNLYIGPLDFTPAGQPASLVDFHDPDHIKFPKFKTAMAHAHVAELDAGDAIFIPSMWWHHVEALSDVNVLVNYWWRQVPMHMGAPADALHHALLAIKDLPAAQRDAWRDLFEHYVFTPKDQAHIPAHAQGILKPIDEQQARKLRAMLLNNLNR